MQGAQTRFLSLCFFLGFLTASREAQGGGFFCVGISTQGQDREGEIT